MKWNVKILILIFLFGNSHLFSQTQSEKVKVFIEKANEALLKMPKVDVTYSWQAKPFLTPKYFKAQVHLSVDRSILNNDSVFGFVVDYGSWFQYFMNNELCSGGADSIVTCRTIDTIRYHDNNELIRSSMQVLRPFVRNTPFKILEEELQYYNIQEIIIGGEECTRITRVKSDDEVKYDSTILDFRNKDYLLLKSRYVAFNNEADDINVQEFDSISFILDSEINLLKTKEKWTNGFRQKYFDPYTKANDEEKDTISILPDFELEDVDGKKFSSRSLKTNFALVDFSYASCYYCMKSLPGICKIKERFKDDLAVFMINPYDYDHKNYSDSVFKKRGINYPIYFLDRKNSEIKLTVQAFPTIFLVEIPSMKIVERYTGFNEAIESKMIADIERSIKS